MKIGYPCINNALGYKSNKTFRLKSFTPELFKSTVELNLIGLQKTLEYNVKHGFLFFRISSDIIPFASHEVMQLKWIEIFKDKLRSIGVFIKDNNIRISMHPDQFVVLNSPTESIVQNSIRELQYHADFLNSLKLDNTAKIQIHAGGVYSDKKEAIKRFVKTFNNLDSTIKDRLVVENDDRSYSLKDVYDIYKETEIPILFDNLHHDCLNNNEDLLDAMKCAFSTWKVKDGLPMTDYSSQEINARKGKHTNCIDLKHFESFLNITKGLDFDIMLEIKDKEVSCLKALKLIKV